jgi:hypothetical protein
MKKQKLNYGIRGLFFLELCYTLWPVGIDKSLMSSFLSSRQQKVKIGNAVSELEVGRYTDTDTAVF